MLKQQNQQHPPTKGTVTSDNKGNSYYALCLKKNDKSTTIICDGITMNAALFVANTLKNALRSVHSELEGELITIKSSKRKRVEYEYKASKRVSNNKPG